MIKTVQNRSWQYLIGLVLRRGIVLFVLLALVVYFSSATDRFFQARNLINVLEQNVALVIVTVGMTLTMLIAGIDLSVGSVAAFCGAVSAGLIVRNGFPFGLSVVATLLIGLGIGLVNGLLIVRGKLPPFVATLAMLGIARGMTLVYTQGRPISGMGDAYTFWGRGDVMLPLIGETPASVLVALWVIVMASLLLSHTRFGLHVYAIGGNEETAQLAGVPVDRIKLIVYSLSGMLSALAGIVLTARLFSAQPQAAVGLELDAIAAAVLGGVSLFGGIGNIFGALIGGLLVGVLSNGLNLMRVASYQQQMIQGGVLVLAVAADMLMKRIERT